MRSGAGSPVRCRNMPLKGYVRGPLDSGPFPFSTSLRVEAENLQPLEQRHLRVTRAKPLVSTCARAMKRRREGGPPRKGDWKHLLIVVDV
jgi:hypothetical protein